jgi:hypothetical protein
MKRSLRSIKTVLINKLKILRSQFASSNDEYYRLRSQNLTLNKGQIEYMYDEYISKDNINLSLFVITFDYE